MRNRPEPDTNPIPVSRLAKTALACAAQHADYGDPLGFATSALNPAFHRPAWCPHPDRECADRTEFKRGASDGYRPPTGTQPGHFHESLAGLPQARRGRAAQPERFVEEGLRGERRRSRQARCPVSGPLLDRLGLVCGRRRAAIGALPRHDAPARQQLPAARRRRPAAAAALRVRDGDGRAQAPAPRQLRVAEDHAAGRRDRRSEAPTVRDHRPARGPRPGHRRVQG